MDHAIKIEYLDMLKLTRDSRSYRLREMCWQGTHQEAQHTRRIGGYYIVIKGTKLVYTADFFARKVNMRLVHQVPVGS